MSVAGLELMTTGSVAKRLTLSRHIGRHRVSGKTKCGFNQGRFHFFELIYIIMGEVQSGTAEQPYVRIGGMEVSLRKFELKTLVTR